MDEIKKTENVQTPAPVKTASAVPPARAPFQGGQRGGSFGGQRSQFPPRNFGGGGGGMGMGGGMRKNPRRSQDRGERVKQEFDNKMIGVRRVTRVVAGGKRFNFAVAIVVGNRKGSVGVGTGKSGDTASAIEKATRDAKKNIIKIPLTKTGSIPYPIQTKYSSAILALMPSRGKGLVAGSAVRDVLEIAGVKDVVAKLLSGSKNRLNIAMATMQALRMLAGNKNILKSKPAKAVV